jgi:tetratricopeptide (TPR) repeat protein
MKTSLEQGIELFQSGEYTEALDVFLGGGPDQSTGNLDYAYYIGLTYMKLKQYEDALAYLELVVTAGASFEQVYQCRLLLGIVYTLTGRDRLADFEFRKLLDSGYKTAAVYAALAYVAWTQQKTNESISFYEMALAKEKNCGNAMNGLGYVLACLGKDLAVALKLCRKAVETSPDSAACLDSLGWVLYKLGNLKEARKYLEKAKKINSEHKDINIHYEELVGAEKKAATGGKL